MDRLRYLKFFVRLLVGLSRVMIIINMIYLYRVIYTKVQFSKDLLFPIFLVVLKLNLIKKQLNLYNANFAKFCDNVNYFLNRLKKYSGLPFPN